MRRTGGPAYHTRVKTSGNVIKWPLLATCGATVRKAKFAHDISPVTLLNGALKADVSKWANADRLKAMDITGGGLDGRRTFANGDHIVPMLNTVEKRKIRDMFSFV